MLGRESQNSPAVITDETIEDVIDTVYADLGPDRPDAHVSQYRSRSAPETRVVETGDIAAVNHDAADLRDHRLRAAVDTYLAERDDVISTKVRVGERDPIVYEHVTLEPYARIAQNLLNLYEPADPDATPDLRTYQVPNVEHIDGDVAFSEPGYDVAGDARIIVDPTQDTTHVLGTDYFGEAKKAVLRPVMFRAKQGGDLGLHAGSKHTRIEDENVYDILFGLSGTGKTTLTSHGLGLDGEEYTEMIQDDVVVLQSDGRVDGTEGRGLYVKTNGLTDDQHEILNALEQPETVLENVTVRDGEPDYDDAGFTVNGRAGIRREHLESAAETIDMPQTDRMFFITRNRYTPPMARLSPEQGAAAFMLGESVETGAGDEDSIGETVRVPGFNPFIIGPAGAEGNRLYELIQDNDIDCYLLNTGYVDSPEAGDITVGDTTGLLEAATRAYVNGDDDFWTDDAAFEMDVPQALVADDRTIDGVDLDGKYPPAAIDDFETEWAAFNADRQAYLQQFPELDADIITAFNSDS